jgi:hypothetical protein
MAFLLAKAGALSMAFLLAKAGAPSCHPVPSG